MAGSWYYKQGASEFGPVSLPQLQQFARAGRLTVADWVRDGEDSPWIPIARVPAVMSMIGSATSAAPPARRPAPAPHLSSPAPIPQPMPLGAASAAPRPAPHHSGSVAPIPHPIANAPRPMAVPAPMPVARPAPLPMGAAVAPHSHAATAPHHPPTSVLERRSKKSSTSTAIVLGICGVGGALVLGVVLILATMGGGESETTVAQNTAGADASDASKQTNAGAESTNSLVGAQLGMTKAIRAWRDPAKKGVLKGLISFEVKRVYWSDSAAPKDDAAAKLLVEIAVTNTGTDPLTYTSWNAPGKSGAWLVDADLQPVASVSGSGSSQQLTPQQTITETLEFATPSKDFNELRLVLPYAAIQRSGQWGYTLSAAVLAGEPLTKPTTAVAKAPASPMPAAEEKPAEPDEPQILKIPDDAAPGIAAKEEPMVDDGEPKEDIRDLIKQSVEPKK